MCPFFRNIELNCNEIYGSIDICREKMIEMKIQLKTQIVLLELRIAQLFQIGKKKAGSASFFLLLLSLFSTIFATFYDSALLRLLLKYNPKIAHAPRKPVIQRALSISKGVPSPVFGAFVEKAPPPA